MDRVKGKVGLITGGAMGIGAACARLLAREGAAVASTDVNIALGSKLAEEINCAGGAAPFVAHDVAEESAWRRAISATLERFGRLDIANPSS